MPDIVAPYYVLPDANIWVAERLLQSSIGSAFLYSVTRAKSSILLPEVVELEVGQVLHEKAERGVGVIQRELSLLRQLSGHKNLSVLGPSPSAIKEGIQARWKQLSGLLITVPFTHDQAKSALSRVIRKVPPSGEKNNEQFRDCCVWESAVSMATDRTVHVVSGDLAFYENRNKKAGLASALGRELTVAKKAIRLHSGLEEFLAAVAGSVAIDETPIRNAITDAILDRAREIAEGRPAPLGTTFQLGQAHQTKITGYETPQSSLVAISFEASFDLEAIIVEDGTETHEQGTMRLNGGCSYDPIAKEVSEIEVKEWFKSLRNWGAGSADRVALERQYDPGRTRPIS